MGIKGRLFSYNAQTGVYL